MFHPASDLNDFAPVIRRSGANLPHWRLDGATYAVTFHLADSIPSDQLKRWRIEREHIVARAEAMDRPLTEYELRRLDTLYGEKVEHWLDQAYGSCVLNTPTIASLVQNALRHFDGERYTLLAWCVMPNHVHAVVQPRSGHDLSRILLSWKGFSGKKAREILDTRGGGEFWQHESYDRIIRDHLELRRQVRYVLDNPRKSNLHNWPWVGCADWILELLGGASSESHDTPTCDASRIGRKPDGTVEQP